MEVNGGMALNRGRVWECCFQLHQQTSCNKQCIQSKALRLNTSSVIRESNIYSESRAAVEVIKHGDTKVTQETHKLQNQ